ncbi:MAG: SHD1 domain-containing protein, partial [Planctomycetia bacterium]|nr:SHD1 domain-containing protein [Planctomycetia bacterium]
MIPRINTLVGLFAAALVVALPASSVLFAAEPAKSADVPNAAAGAMKALFNAGSKNLLPGEVRHWRDNTGRFETRAGLVGASEKTATLKKANGRLVDVPLARLSEGDRDYLAAWQRQGMSSAKSWQPVAAQIAPRVQGWLNGDEALAADVFPTPDAVHIRLGNAYLNRRFAREIDRTVPVRDTILGTPIRGTSDVDGDVTIVATPAEENGALLVKVRGVAHSRTVGTHHPVWIHSRSTTTFVGTKRVNITPDGVTFLPAEVTATSRSRSAGISTSLPRLRGRIATNIASRRVEESRPEADRISAAHNRDRVARDIDRQVEKSLKRTDDFLSRHHQRFSEALGLEDAKVTSRSTNDYLEFAFASAEPSHPSTPPEFVSDADVEILLHTPSVTPIVVGPAARLVLTNLFNALLDDVLEERADRKDRAPVECQLVWSRDQQWLAIQASREA